MNSKEMISDATTTVTPTENIFKHPNFEKEENVMKFYYLEEEDLYLIGKRCDTFYYATVEYISSHKCFNITYRMSRYLPWGTENYPQEPKEISFEKWLSGYLKQLLDKHPNYFN